jgi:hypothetical protein
MTVAIDHIAAKCNLPPRQRLQALCWTGHKYSPRMVWMLSERTNTRSSKELRVSGRDLPPTAESLAHFGTSVTTRGDPVRSTFVGGASVTPRIISKRALALLSELDVAR